MTHSHILENYYDVFWVTLLWKIVTLLGHGRFLSVMLWRAKQGRNTKSKTGSKEAGLLPLNGEKIVLGEILIAELEMIVAKESMIC